MMQMLEAGGVPPLTDSHRAPDESNPRGFYELDGVKSLAKDTGCLDGAPAHAVKVIHRLLPHLPRDQRYAVIFMRRDLAEVIASQQAMLGRLGATGATLDPNSLASIFRTEMTQAIDFICGAPNARLLEIEHRGAVSTPLETAHTLERFLCSDSPAWESAINIEAMASAVDPTLYRERSNS